MDSKKSVPRRPTLLRVSTTYVVTAWTTCVLIGAGLGWAVRALSEWASTLDGLPFHDWISIIAKVPDPYGTVLCLILGAVFGGFVSRMTLKDSVAVSVSQDRVIWRSGRRTRRIGRDEISAIYLDGVDDLVFLGRETQELARANNNLSEDQVKETFLRYGHPFFDADPHLDEFVPWVEDMPELSATVNLLLKARQKALQEDKPTDDAAELRTDLGKHGVIVRQKDDRQFYRLIGKKALAEGGDAGSRVRVRTAAGEGRAPSGPGRPV